MQLRRASAICGTSERSWCSKAATTSTGSAPSWRAHEVAEPQRSAPTGLCLPDAVAQLLQARRQEPGDVHLAHADGCRDFRLRQTFDEAHAQDRLLPGRKRVERGSKQSPVLDGAEIPVFLPQ